MDERVRGDGSWIAGRPRGGVPGPSAVQALPTRVAEALSAEDGSRRGIIAAIEDLLDALADLLDRGGGACPRAPYPSESSAPSSSSPSPRSTLTEPIPVSTTMSRRSSASSQPGLV